jgi:hypothetical protein
MAGVVTINFKLPELRNPEDPYSDRLGSARMPIPRDGQIVTVAGCRYRVVCVETVRLELLTEPWVTLVNEATVLPV